MDTGRQLRASHRDRGDHALVPQIALRVIHRATQIHGGGGVSDDFPLASMYAHPRTLRLADGPDEVHCRTIARRELEGA
jgi:acyl-CoA dehydrogenase